MSVTGGGSGNKIEKDLIVALRSNVIVVVFVIQVIQFGADCDHDECTCRDPNAEENKGKTKQMQDAGGGVQWEVADERSKRRREQRKYYQHLSIYNQSSLITKKMGNCTEWNRFRQLQVHPSSTYPFWLLFLGLRFGSQKPNELSLEILQQFSSL